MDEASLAGRWACGGSKDGGAHMFERSARTLRHHACVIKHKHHRVKTAVVGGTSHRSKAAVGRSVSSQDASTIGSASGTCTVEFIGTMNKQR